jgi:hypothetical protein
MMDLDEMLALMAAQIYAARLGYAGGSSADALAQRVASDPWRVAAMSASVEDAVTLWGFVVTRKSGAAE